MKSNGYPSLFDTVYESGYRNAPCHPGLKKSTFLVDKLDPKSGEEILYLGCGDGKIAKDLMKQGVKLVAIDNDEKRIIEARKRDVRALLGNAENLDYHRRFDAVFMDSPHYPIYDCKRAIGRIMRSIKPGGRFIAQISVNGNLPLLDEAVDILFSKHPEWKRKISKWSYPDRDECIETLGLVGFDNISTKMIFKPVEIYFDGKWFYERVDEIAAHVSADEKHHLYALLSKYIRQTSVMVNDRLIADYAQLDISAHVPL